MTTKIHAIAHALDNPVTPGQASDLGNAEPLLEQVDPKAVLADKAYDADALDYRDIRPAIPPKANRLIKRSTDFTL